MAGWNSYFDAPLLQQLIYAQGVPAANRISYAQYAYLGIPAGGTISPNYDLGNAVSYLFAVQIWPAVTNPANFGLVDLRIKFYDSILGVNIVDSIRYRLWVQGGMSFTDQYCFILQDQCPTPFMGIDATFPASIGGEIDFWITTTSRSVNKFIYRGDPQYLQTVRSGQIMIESGSRFLGQPISIGQSGVNFTAGENVNVFPAFRVGEAIMQAYTSTTLVGGVPAVFSVVTMHPDGSTSIIDRIIIPAASVANSAAVGTELYIPNETCYVNIFNGSTSPAELHLNITQNDVL